MRYCFLPALGCLALFAPGAAFGQAGLATVTGVVTDATKAPVAGAKVTIRNTETGDARTAAASAEGSYTFAELPVGEYELSVSKQGFEAFRQGGLKLEVDDQVRRDVELMVGSVGESITVTAAPDLLNSQNGAIKGAVVVQEEIEDVPLDSRDFTDIALLVPGVIPTAQGGNGAMSVNGARADNTNYYVDGFSDRSARAAAAQFRPNVDALEEFKMETIGFSAEYGKMAGGIMNMVLKSGTNQLHGTVFEYFRNDVFDARSFFDPVRLPLHRNQYGAELGGPVRIPRLYNGHDKTFFMFSYEAYRHTDGETELSNVPTLAEHTGDFAGVTNVNGKPVTITDPLASNTPFPDGIISASRLSPVGLNIMKWYPLPNYMGIGLNYQATATVSNHWESILGKLDHRFSDRDSLSARYCYRWNPYTTPWAGTSLGNFGNVISDDRLMGGMTEVHSFTPTLLNELRAGVSRNSEHEHMNTSAGQPTAAQLGMAGSTTDPLAAGFPRITVTNYATLGYTVSQPQQFFVSDYQIGDVLTWIKGRHILKFGADVSIDQYNEPYYSNQRGSFTANGVWTGNGTAANGDAVADLMLGLLNVSSITQSVDRNYFRWTTWGMFVNDDFRVTPTLTLNLGLRYEIDPRPRDKYGRMMNFLPGLGKIIVASDATIPNLNDLVHQAGLDGMVGLAKDYGLPQSLVFTDYKDFAPRLGFAWRPFGSQRTVLRGGYGWFYSGTMLNDILSNMGTTFPFASSLSFSRVASNPGALTLENPWPGALATLTGTNTSAGFEEYAPTGYVQSYNLTVEREIGGGNVLEVGYVGSKGTHLGRLYNINQPVRTIPWYMANGTNFPSPWPLLSTINYFDFGSNSIYGSGQVMLQKRARNGFFYRLAYSYSKSIDDTSQLTGSSAGGYNGAIDPRNLRLERGRSDFDRGHVFTAMFSYPLPVGRGKMLLPNAGKVLGGMFARWQLTGTITAYTGAPFTVKDSSTNATIGQSNRPNRIASGKSTSGTGTRGLDYPWFNPGAFVPTAKCASRTNCSPDQYGFLPFAPGNSGRNILDGPGTFNTNAALMKNFQLAERRSIQARWEVLNVFNHPNFQLPDGNYNETAAGIISGVQGVGNGGPRTVQFAVKYIF